MFENMLKYKKQRIKYMKKFAFTMAEVMIVIGLLGVIAALTIPNLYYNKTKHEYATKIKNFYSKVDNAVAQMELEKGSFRDMKLPEDHIAAYNWYMENIDPFVGHKYIDTECPSNKSQVSETVPCIYLKDGSRISFYKGGCVDVNYDVNGDNGNGKYGRETFKFLFCFSDSNRNTYFGDKNTFFGTYGSGIVSTNSSGAYKAVSRQDMINKCADATTRSWCSKLLQYDNWEFKHDYPAFR